MTIREKILELMQEKQISYGELSKMTGLTKATLYNYATGKTKKLAINNLDKIAKALNIDVITGDKLTISKSQARTSTGSYVIKAPKSYAGYRELNIPPIIQEVLNRKKRGRGRVVPLDAEKISACFRVIMRHVDVEKFRFHDLRHFFASTLLVLGVPDLYAIKLTGHSTTSMLKTVYQHTFKSEEERYKSLINSAFST